MLIPPDALAPATLRNLVEEFVTREGTDYGDYSYTLDDKVAQVLQQLEKGSIVILYDPHTTSCQLELRERVPAALLDDTGQAGAGQEEEEGD